MPSRICCLSLGQYKNVERPCCPNMDLPINIKQRASLPYEVKTLERDCNKNWSWDSPKIDKNRLLSTPVGFDFLQLTSSNVINVISLVILTSALYSRETSEIVGKLAFNEFLRTLIRGASRDPSLRDNSWSSLQTSQEWFENIPVKRSYSLNCEYPAWIAMPEVIFNGSR